MKKIIFAILAIVLVISLVGCQSQNQTISVVGESKVVVKPDQAEVWTGFTIVKPTAEEAQNEANKVISAIVSGLKASGIAESDIGTEQLTLNQEQVWEDNKIKNLGWRATQIIKVKTKDLSKIGPIVDAAVNNGANQINNINFELSVEKEKQYKEEVLSKATIAAKDKAEIMAKSLGAKLGKIMSVSQPDSIYTPYTYAMRDMAGSAAVKEAATVLPSDLEINAQVTIVYEIKS